MTTLDRELLTGTRVLKTIGLWLLLAVIVCAGSWYALYFLLPGSRGTNTPTLVLVAEAYALLPLAAAIVFGGIRAAANAVLFTYTGNRYLVIAVALWAGTLLLLFCAYAVVGAVGGSPWPGHRIRSRRQRHVAVSHRHAARLGAHRGQGSRARRPD